MHVNQSDGDVQVKEKFIHMLMMKFMEFEVKHKGQIKAILWRPILSDLSKMILTNSDILQKL